MITKYLAAGIAYIGLLVGVVALLLFAVFLFVGSFSVFNFGCSELACMAFDAGLSLMFFVQHSAMLRKSFRDAWQRFVPAPYYGACYAAVSGIMLFILLVFWQKSAIVLISAAGIFRWGLRLLFFTAILGFGWSTLALGAFDPFGLKSIVLHLKNRHAKPMPFVIRGPYRFMRHPIYFFSLLMIWSCPDVGADRLLFNGLWTLWIIIGTMLEERDLVREFGASYRQYQKSIPMLIPWKFMGREN